MIVKVVDEKMIEGEDSFLFAIASHHILPVADVAANDVAVAVDDNDDPATVCYQLPVLYRKNCIQ